KCWVAVRAVAHRQVAVRISSRVVGVSLSSLRAATSSAAARSPVRSSSLLRHRLTNRQWISTTISRSDIQTREKQKTQTMSGFFYNRLAGNHHRPVWRSVAHGFNHHHFNVFPDGGNVYQRNAKQTCREPACGAQP